MILLKILSISGILNGVSCFSLGLFVFLRDKKNETFSAYFRHAIAIGAWSIGYYFWPTASDKTVALNIFRYLHLGAAFVSITYYHFIVAWAGEVDKRRISLKIGYILAIIFCISVPTRFFIYGVEPRFIFKFWGIPGPMYHLFLLFLLLFLKI